MTPVIRHKAFIFYYRYYLRKDGVCIMRMVDAEFEYTYEYQGNAPKLVHTPLTDKCYLTLTQGKRLQLYFFILSINVLIFYLVWDPTNVKMIMATKYLRMFCNSIAMVTKISFGGILLLLGLTLVVFNLSQDIIYSPQGPWFFNSSFFLVGMSMGLGGNPYGPAGTGKTESVKALGGLFGRQVLVFNCDEVSKMLLVV